MADLENIGGRKKGGNQGGPAKKAVAPPVKNVNAPIDPNAAPGVQGGQVPNPNVNQPVQQVPPQIQYGGQFPQGFGVQGMFPQPQLAFGAPPGQQGINPQLYAIGPFTSEDVDNGSVGIDDPDQSEFANFTLEKLVAAISAEEYSEIFLAQINLFAFAGFNPKDVFDTLRKLAFAAGITLEEFIKDVVDLVSYYIARGTTIQRRGIWNSQSQAASLRIQMLINRYRIQDNVGPNSKGRNIITLGRIMNTFPEIISTKFAKGMKNPIGQIGIVPLAYMFPGGAALIPAMKTWDGFYEKFLDWSVTFDRVINRLKRQAAKTQDPKTPDFDEKSSKDNQRIWSDLARTNSRLSDNFRLAHFYNNTDDFQGGVTYNEAGEITATDWTTFKPVVVV